jgi:hypothetical protein
MEKLLNGDLKDQSRRYKDNIKTHATELGQQVVQWTDVYWRGMATNLTAENVFIRYFMGKEVGVGSLQM